MKFLILALALVSTLTSAQDSQEKRWAHESEASVVTTTGNTETQTYSLKETTSYKFEKNIIENKASYLLQKDSGDKKAENWLISLRYEREITEKISGFVMQTVDSDKFASIYRRYSTDIGGKYFFVKEDAQTLFAELGYRYSYEDYLSPKENDDVHFGRLYVEGNKKWTQTLSTKAWVEFLPNFTESDDYRLNAEPSASVMLSEIFSLKLAYLMKYRGNPPAGVEDLDTVYTTAIVAKF